MRVFLISFLFFFFPLTIFSSSEDDYLVETGKDFLKQGSIEDAQTEFKKALIINPSNKEAKKYLSDIRFQKINNTLDLLTPKAETEKIVISPKEEIYTPKETKESHPQEKAQKLQPKEETTPALPEETLKKETSEEESPKLELSGDYQLSLGFEGKDAIWKRANADLSEENWRIVSDAAYNRRENTFDPAIFSQLRFRLDYPQEEGWAFHSYFDVSPWSFIGKSDTVTVDGTGGDTAEVELKYWSNTRRTVNETIYTSLNGDYFSLPEIKVADNMSSPTAVTSNFSNTFNIPELKIHREVWPLREIWTDYNTDSLSLKIFPVGDEDFAYSSDDPLGLANRHIYWEESQWLVKWQPGHLNTGANPQDFFRGFWDDTLAFMSRDSSFARLTSLRGFSLSLYSEKASLGFTGASPKELWQDYDNFDTRQTTLRGKYFPLDNLSLGFLHAAKIGYNDQDKLDGYSHTLGFDANIGLGENTEVFLEAATSRSEYDRGNPRFMNRKRGNTFHLSLINSSQEVFGKDYFGITPFKEEPFYKLRLSLTHMDKGFESVLASFRETRHDTFWSRHLHFREPLKYYFAGFYEPSLSWEDVKVFRIGDGIDYGRDVVSLRIEAENILDDRLDTLFDFRNVHDSEGKFIENVTRLEGAYQVTDKLTAKFLGLRQDMPKTKQGIDPFIFDPVSGDSYQNSSIVDGRDPTLKTLSLGTKYDFFDWLDVSFIWERTNDSSLAYNNFPQYPRGLLNSTSFTTFTEFGYTFRKEQFSLDQPAAFPLPPYSYFDIFRTGLGLRPKDNFQFYLTYTRNEYRWAQILDDNMNHIGLEANYLPTDNFGIYLRYVYSKVNDISELSEESRVVKRSHHNIFSELRLRIKEESELVVQYGVGNLGSVTNANYNPYGGSVATLDTQHMVRLYYRKKF